MPSRRAVLTRPTVTSEDDFLDAFWFVSVQGVNFWVDECTCYFPVCDERHAKALCWEVCRCVSGCKTAEEHLSHLRQVLQTLRENQFYANPKKCDFTKEEISFLGHWVSTNGLKVDPEKVRAVADWKVPRDVHGVRSFLGLANYFRRYLQGYSKMFVSLTDLSRKDMRFIWTSECQEAFEKVKHALTNAPVLAPPELRKPFEVVSDASGVGLGAVLL
jgi:hypothetical protein